MHIENIQKIFLLPCFGQMGVVPDCLCGDGAEAGELIAMKAVWKGESLGNWLSLTDKILHMKE